MVFIFPVCSLFKLGFCVILTMYSVVQLYLHFNDYILELKETVLVPCGLYLYELLLYKLLYWGFSNFIGE